MQAELAPGAWMKAPEYACKVDLAGKLRTLNPSMLRKQQDFMSR